MLDIRYIKDMIKNGEVDYKIGDIVVLFRRKKNGYPKSVCDGLEYRVGDIKGDSLVLYIEEPFGQAKVHKTYMVHSDVWRRHLRDRLLAALLPNN